MSFERLAIIAFSIVGALLFLDVTEDVVHGADMAHVAMELAAFLVCLLLLLWKLLETRRSWLDQARGMKEKVAQVEQERDLWQAKSRELLQGLSQAIDEQFSAWQLTEAEKEVGLLILKGLAHKEIAAARNSSERTVRQQAASLYAKSGLAGKASLSAFFLEELLLPRGA